MNKYNVGETIFFVRRNSSNFWSVKRGEIVEVITGELGVCYKTKNDYIVDEDEVHATYSQARRVANDNNG